MRIKIPIRSSVKQLDSRAVIGPSSRRVKILQGDDVWKCELSCHVNSSRYECVELGLNLDWLRRSAGCVLWLSFRINELVAISNTNDSVWLFLTYPYLDNTSDSGKLFQNTCFVLSDNLVLQGAKVEVEAFRELRALFYPPRHRSCFFLLLLLFVFLKNIIL